MTERTVADTRPATRRPGVRHGSNWRVPVALVVLSVIPVVAGSLRLLEIAGGPHLLPINRGILSTIYVRVRDSVTEGMVSECYEKAYGQEPFVRLFPSGRFPEVKFVAHTNYCDIGWKLESSRFMLVIISAIDNLVKGAAGQALQNMNVMLGLDETAGLI